MLRGVSARAGVRRRLPRPQHEPLQAGGHDERRGGVHEEHLQELQRGHLVQREAPGVVRPQVDLLQVEVEQARREERDLDGPGEHEVGRARGLGEEGRGELCRTVPSGGRAPRLVTGQQASLLLGQCFARAELRLDQVGVESGWPPDRLAGVWI